MCVCVRERKGVGGEGDAKERREFTHTRNGTVDPSTILQALPSLCDLRNMEDFPYTTELEAAFGTVVKVMGPRYIGHPQRVRWRDWEVTNVLVSSLCRVVLEAVPLQLDQAADSASHDFPRSWILPVMKEYIEHTELAYFTQTMLPLAAQLRSKGGCVLSHDCHMHSVHVLSIYRNSVCTSRQATGG